MLLPLAAVAMASPITAGAIGQLPSSDAILLVSPTFLAITAAPGYLRAVLGWVSVPRLSSAGRVWVRASFLLGLCAAGIGAVIGLAFIIPSVTAILTAVTVVRIWRQLEVRSAGA